MVIKLKVTEVRRHSLTKQINFNWIWKSNAEIYILNWDHKVLQSNTWNRLWTSKSLKVKIFKQAIVAKFKIVCGKQVSLIIYAMCTTREFIISSSKHSQFFMNCKTCRVKKQQMTTRLESILTLWAILRCFRGSFISRYPHFTRSSQRPAGMFVGWYFDIVLNLSFLQSIRGRNPTNKNTATFLKHHRVFLHMYDHMSMANLQQTRWITTKNKHMTHQRATFVLSLFVSHVVCHSIENSIQISPSAYARVSGSAWGTEKNKTLAHLNNILHESTTKTFYKA